MSARVHTVVEKCQQLVTCVHRKEAVCTTSARGQHQSTLNYHCNGIIILIDTRVPFIFILYLLHLLLLQ